MSKEKQLLSAFEELREALFDCNQSKLKELVSNEYQGFSLNGTIENKELVLQTYKPGFIKLSKYLIKDMKFEVSDDFKLINKRWQYYKSQATEIKSA